MIFFSAKQSAVHDMHINAISEYAGRLGHSIGPKVSGFGSLVTIFRSRDKVLFSQSSGLASVLVLPFARVCGKKVIHYLHEPTPLSKKLQDNPWIKSLVWHFVQFLEVHAASKVMISRPALAKQAEEVFKLPGSKIILAPLLMPEVNQPEGSEKSRITYLGRIDERRYFTDFLKTAPQLRNDGFKPTILTGDIETLEKYKSEIPAEIEVFAERNFSEDLKTEIVSDTLCLWNPKSGAIAQSGVTADAVRYGVSILLTDRDPSFGLLLENKMCLDFESARKEGFSVFKQIDPEAVRTVASSIFSAQHGETAFRDTYHIALEEPS